MFYSIELTCFPSHTFQFIEQNHWVNFTTLLTDHWFHWKKIEIILFFFVIGSFLLMEESSEQKRTTFHFFVTDQYTYTHSKRDPLFQTHLGL